MLRISNLKQERHRMKPKFPFGQTVITCNAQRQLNPEDVAKALARHAAGDWGEIGAHDKQLNDEALHSVGPILSAFFERRGIKFWIITDFLAFATLVLLPSDFACAQFYFHRRYIIVRRMS
jgi:hypothetical protein